MIAWSATTTGVSRDMVRDLMVACVERRFGATRTPHAVEWLSDNGSAYIARDNARTATALGLHLASTPVRSPESNGIAEAFVKSLKRDYARVTSPVVLDHPSACQAKRGALCSLISSAQPASVVAPKCYTTLVRDDWWRARAVCSR